MRLIRLLPLALAAVTVSAQAAPELPRVVTKDGRSALFVDGAPFLMLGAQANNSSNYPAALPKVWPVLDKLNANTLEIPVAWQQIEPVEGKFDFSYLDALLKGAREHNLRLVLLWFGTWKNTSSSYAPDWVKTDNSRFPRMRTRDGKAHYVLSPHARTTLDADKRAFVALMQRLKAIDPQNTVIMVQVENETGSYGSTRDFSAEANALFAQPIPKALAAKTGKSGNWTQAFGKLADTAFNAWYVSRYVDEVAAAGQAVKNLPMYANAALGGPFGPAESGGASGGPDWPVIDVWRAGAPRTSRWSRPTSTAATPKPMPNISISMRGPTIPCWCPKPAIRPTMRVSCGRCWARAGSASRHSASTIRVMPIIPSARRTSTPRR